MPDIVAVVIENPEQPIKAILAPSTETVAAVVLDGRGISGYSGFSGGGGGGSGISGYSGYSGAGTSGYSGFSGPAGISGYSGFSGADGSAGTSGYSGFCGLSGYSGFSGSGLSGYSGFSGTNGATGTSGFSGYSGTSGYSGFSGSGISGYSGFSGSGISGYSGFCGLSGYSGFCGLSGYSGFCGTGTSGYSGFSGDPAQQSGYSGYCGLSGYSGFCGLSGYSGFCGLSGYSGFCGLSGYSGFSGAAGTGGAFTLNASTGSVSLVAGTNISFSSNVSTITISGGSTLVAGSGISLTSGGSSITIIDTGAGIKLLQNFDLHRAAATVVTKAGTVTGTAGVGSSLFLSRITAPSVMSLTEIDVAMSIGFPATNQGAGTLSRSMVVYSFGNSTSLASVLSVSGTSAWNTGTSTAGASGSLTQFQGGWSAPFIQPFTFASTSLAPGEYVVGQLFNFAQGSSTWTLAFYGDPAASTFLASAATNLTSATLGADSVATVAASGITGMSSYGSAFIAGSMISVVSSMSISAAVVMSSNSTGTLAAQISLSSTGTQKTATVGVGYVSTNSNILSSLGTVAGSIINGRTTLGAVTNVALGALNSSTLAQLTLPNFGYIGTGSTTSGFPTAFMAGIMSTGAVPTAITLTSTAVTYSGSVAFQQPWFALVGQ